MTFNICLETVKIYHTLATVRKVAVTERDLIKTKNDFVVYHVVNHGQMQILGG